MSRKKPESTKNEVVGSVPVAYLFLPVLTLGLGIYIPIAPWTLPSPKAPKWSDYFFIAPFSLLFIWFGLYLFKGMLERVVADENGLRWRMGLKWRSTMWPQVRDFYVEPHLQDRRSFIVETEVGDFRLNSLTNRAKLQAVIAQRAKWAKSKRWEERFAQDLELSGEEVFETDLRFVRQFPWMMAFMCSAVPLMFGSKVIGSGPPNWAKIWATLNMMGWPTVIATMLTVLAMASLYPLMMYAHYPRVRAIKQHAGQRILVSPNGIEWQNGADSIRARWDEVTDFYRATIPGWVESPGRFVVETRRGTFDWIVGGIDKCVRLNKLVEKYAAGGALGKWREKRVEKREAFASGDCVYTYRTRDVRALLWLVTAIALIICALTVLGILGFGPRAKTPADIATDCFMMALSTGGCLFAWFCYKCFEIRTSSDGLSVRHWRKTLFVSWPEIQEYDYTEGFCRVRGAGKTIRFYGLLDRVEELKAEIQKRAVNSLSKQW